MPISEIQLLSIPVSNQTRALDFYVNQLGMELVADTAIEQDRRWVQVRPRGGSTSIALVTWFPTMPAGSSRGTVLEADDIEKEVALLRSRGVPIGGEIEEAPWGRFVSFDDPDGNGLVLQQTASAARAR